VWGEGNEDEKLNAAIRGALKLGDQLSVSSIAFPAVSTGIFGFPKERAAIIIFQAIQDYFIEHPKSVVALVRITLFDQDTLDIFHQVWNSTINPKEVTG
jgi:O-acetyl-ADP-ribose deacetylase (regulator of RNase III)